jgi:hypothetical protein
MLQPDKDAAKAQAALDKDALAIADAQQNVLDAQAAIADEARARTEEDRRSQIAGVKDFITAIDKLVSDSTDSKTTLADLAKRQKALQAGGPAAPGSDRALELAAVLAAEQRVRQQATNTAKQTELAAAKDALAAVNTSESAKQAAYRKTRAEIVANITKLEAAAVQERKDAAEREKLVKRYAKTVVDELGAKSPAVGALEAARLAGLKFGTDMKQVLSDLVDGLKTVIGWVATLTGSLDKAALGARYLTDPAFRDAVNKAANKAGIATPGPLDFFTSLPDALKGLLPPGWTGANNASGRAEGGPTQAGRGYMLGERGRELWFPKTDGFALSNRATEAIMRLNGTGRFPAAIPVSGGFPSSGTLIVETLRIDLGGDRLIDLLDRKLAWRTGR